jgi:hypothetical protein
METHKNLPQTAQQGTAIHTAKALDMRRSVTGRSRLACRLVRFHFVAEERANAPGQLESGNP